MDREPCPFRIVDDAGGAFGFGNEVYFLFDIAIMELIENIVVVKCRQDLMVI
jgi:hypothetical protein